jgi:hypothetical protein
MRVKELKIGELYHVTYHFGMWPMQTYKGPAIFLEAFEPKDGSKNYLSFYLVNQKKIIHISSNEMKRLVRKIF